MIRKKNLNSRKKDLNSRKKDLNSRKKKLNSRKKDLNNRINKEINNIKKKLKNSSRKKYNKKSTTTNEINEIDEIDKKDVYMNIYNKEIIKLKEKYKNVKMCCDEKEELKSLLKDINELTEINELQKNLPKIYKHLNDNIEDVQRAEMMKNLLRIFVDNDYYSRKEKKDKLKKYLKETNKIKFKTEYPDLGEEILSTYNVKFYKHKTNPKRFIKEKIITHYDTVSDRSNFHQISSILDEIDIFDRFKNENFTSKLFDYYVYEKDDDIVLYMEIEKKGIMLSKWLKDNVLTDKDKASILGLIKKLHKLNIVYNDYWNTDNLLIYEKGNTKNFYLSSFEKAETKNHMFNRKKNLELEILSGTLEWSTPYDSNELKALIICDIGVKFTL